MANEFPGADPGPFPGVDPEPFEGAPGTSRRERGRRDSRSKSASDAPRRRPPWFLRAFLPTVMILVGLTFAVLWVVVGGYPRDHAKYGTVPIPGATTVRLDAGQIRLYFQESGLTSGESASAPDGISVEMIPAAGGDPLQIDSIPSFIFSSTENGTGHEPFAKVDIPAAGAYRIAATAEGDISAQAKKPEITVGAKPWSPFGSVGLGFLMILALFTALGSLPRLLWIRRLRPPRRKSRPSRRESRASRKSRESEPESREARRQARASRRRSER